MRLNKTQAIELGNALLDAVELIEEGADAVTLVQVGTALVAIGDLETDIAWARIDKDPEEELGEVIPLKEA